MDRHQLFSRINCHHASNQGEESTNPFEQPHWICYYKPPRTRSIYLFDENSKIIFNLLKPSYISLSRNSSIVDAAILSVGFQVPSLSIYQLPSQLPGTMPGLLLKFARWMGLGFVKITIVRRSRDGHIRVFHFTFPHHQSDVSRIPSFLSLKANGLLGW